MVEWPGLPQSVTCSEDLRVPFPTKGARSAAGGGPGELGAPSRPREEKKAPSAVRQGHSQIPGTPTYPTGQCRHQKMDHG